MASFDKGRSHLADPVIRTVMCQAKQLAASKPPLGRDRLDGMEPNENRALTPMDVRTLLPCDQPLWVSHSRG